MSRAPATPALLRSTRRLTTAATVLLGFQLYGNLYEEVVTNVRSIADPVPGDLVGELAPGSPLFFYLPWAPVGVVLVGILAVRLRRTAPAWIARRAALACVALLVAVGAKAYLIARLNPTARDASASPATIRDTAVQWAFVNGIAILAVATALALILTWRTTALDRTTTPEPALHPLTAR